jgi:3'-phosphoadenosine 5'-phosphosulfate sulfotransferase (PAPS reductase)/FAD synthetase
MYESRIYTAQVVADWVHENPHVVFVVNLSAGKDSATAACVLREAEIPHRLVFADTGWEAKETYEYLETLDKLIGPIDRVGVPGGMVAKIRERAGFPARLQRWCTRELKVEPLRVYYDAIEAQGKEAICVTGIRAEESEERAAMPIVEYDEAWRGWMWRPVRDFTIEDVLRMHHRHGIPLNPLYRRGHNRVGCYPCIFSSKTDIRLVAEHAPERVATIRELEREMTAERLRRNEQDPGRYKYPEATFFQTLIGDRSHYRGPQFIDQIVAWSRTTRGGRQLPMFPEVPDGGCFRWGLCDAPALNREE